MIIVIHGNEVLQYANSAQYFAKLNQTDASWHSIPSYITDNFNCQHQTYDCSDRSELRLKFIS